MENNLELRHCLVCDTYFWVGVDEDNRLLDPLAPCLGCGGYLRHEATGTYVHKARRASQQKREG